MLKASHALKGGCILLAAALLAALFAGCAAAETLPAQTPEQTPILTSTPIPTPAPEPSQTSAPDAALAQKQAERLEEHLLNFAEYPRGEDDFAFEYEGDWDGDGKTDRAYLEGDFRERVAVKFGNGQSLKADAHELEAMSGWGGRFLITAADLTGDGRNEIVLLIDLGGQGGRGSYGLYPYKLGESEWELMDAPRYGSTVELAWENDIATISSGGYSEVVADAAMIQAHYKADHAESEWEVWVKDKIYFTEDAADAICDIAFVENDGHAAVMLSQYVTGMTGVHVDGLGYFVTTLAWDENGAVSVEAMYFVLWPQG
ncbi:MAG: VCBS repeat-containing protein [Clostridiaceae bacterium]|nr:VCBS repeat-containing protein [Eubacteriales bacterium]